LKYLALIAIVAAFTINTTSAESPAPDDIQARYPQSPHVEQGYIPEPPQVAAITIPLGVEVKSLTYEQWRAISLIHPDRQYALARIAWCESRFNPTEIGDGGRSFGAWQVQERFWGAVPSTLEEQALQADRIAAEHGLAPWTTAEGCDGWR
jgi:hypothetical protein